MRFSLAVLRKYQIANLLDMLNFPVPELMVEMRKLSDMLARCQGRAGPFVVPADPSLGQCLRAVERHVATLGLDASIAIARDFIARLDKTVELGLPDNTEVANRIDTLRKCIEYQLEAKVFMFMPNDKVPYWKADMPFGEHVNTKFPNAIEDIDEASKCFAVRRHTATVFHLMRVMELGVQSLATNLGVPLQGRNNRPYTWGEILSDSPANPSQIEIAIRTLPQTTPDEIQRREALQAIISHLHAVRKAWRNTTMHPKAKYDEEEAEEIFSHVRAFIRHLEPLV